jgi:hypothetical protein
MEENKPLSEKESLELITQMINKARNTYYDTGVGAIMWGAVVAICALVKLAEIHFRFKLPFDIYLLTLVAIIPQIFITIKEKKERKVKSYDDSYMDYLWLAFGIGIFLMVLIVNSMAHALQPVMQEYKTLTGRESGFVLFEYIAPLFLILYGLPTFVTGAACKFRPMLWGGLLCWVCCVITVFTTVKIDLLLTAFSAICAWFIPGLILEQEYRKAKRELKFADV